MNSAIGFTVKWRGTDRQNSSADAALVRTLGHFPDLKQQAFQAGASILTLWGRGDLQECTHILPDGSLLVLTGSPTGNADWQMVQDLVMKSPSKGDFRSPWEGRWVLLKISPDGETWTMWNDWLGSIPVYHTSTAHQRIASTLEPAVVAANDFSASDISLPAMAALILHGNLLGDWTLFRPMKACPPDSAAAWDGNGFHVQPLGTIQATDARWDKGWDDLVDEMHHLARRAILNVLRTKTGWIVPLSSGLDSRLIAAVAAEANIPVRTYTWGAPTTRDGVLSKQIARVLGLPWKSIPLGSQYMSDHLRLWADLFGSSMHFHGMYQIPFLTALRGEPAGPVVSGFVGDTLAGYDVKFQSDYHREDQKTPYMVPPNWMFCLSEELEALVQQPVREALEELTDEVDRQRNAVSGPWFQRLRFLTFWGRQRRFTYFQTMLTSYWSDAYAPYLNREYANFCLSLPRALLDKRMLEVDMMRRRYSKVMCIPGSFDAEPAITTGSYLLKRRLAKALPDPFSSKLFPELKRAKNYNTDITALRAGGEQAIWPIPDTRGELSKIFHLEKIDGLYQSAVSQGNILSLRKLQCIQAIALRLMKD